MKKIVVAIVALLSITTASAHNDNSVIINLKGQILNLPQTGLGVEFNFQKSLSHIAPFYIESGISVAKICTVDWANVDFDEFKISDNTNTLLRIPLYINCKFFFDNVTLYPSCGIALSCQIRNQKVLVDHDFFGDPVYEQQFRAIPFASFSLGFTAEINKRIVLAWNCDYSNATFLNPATTTNYCAFSFGYRF